MKYRYFVAFREPHWVRPENILPLIETFKSPSTKEKMLSAYMMILERVSIHANTNGGLSKFMFPQGEEEESWDEVKRLETAVEKRKAFVYEVNYLLNQMKMEHPFKKWHAEAAQITKMIREGRETFENVTIPDPKIVVPKYLESDYAKNLEQELLILAGDDGKCIDWNTLKIFADHLLIRIALKAGNRTDLYQSLVVGDLVRSLKAGFASFPSTPIQPNERNLEDTDASDEYYVNPNPWDVDKVKNDPNWEAKKGK